MNHTCIINNNKELIMEIKEKILIMLLKKIKYVYL